jgi:signal transduction histidine kinase
VTLQVNGGAADIVLEVADDGVGFDTNGSYPGHLGLRSMQERAAAAGGSFEVDSAPGRGTRIRAKIPIQSGI